MEPRQFFDREAGTVVGEHHLPHWEQQRVSYFVTWRLGDALPREKLRIIQQDKENWLKAHPEPWDDKTRLMYHRTFFRRYDEWLDAGAGSCLLRQPTLARLVAERLLLFDGQRYEVDALAVMPNHVHVLVSLSAGTRLSKTVKAWKGCSARAVNLSLNVTGELWQRDYWDRIIRSSGHYFYVREYIRNNPLKAGLREGEYFLWSADHGAPTFLSALCNREAQIKML